MRPMAKGFRIQTVSIEGFKGFTARQEIDLRGLHAFVLGQNGNGKSSIIEAIRWGLFGSTPNEIVPNRGYAERCRVEITFVREGVKWNLRRTLIRGVSGGSDAVLTDENGKVHPLRDIMPQLDASDTGEGMYIIFSSQFDQLRRQPEDLKPFERPVFNYLGLARPQVLLSQLDNFLTQQENTVSTLGDKLTEARNKIDVENAELQRQRGRILATPPWGSSNAPSVAESQTKARSLIEEITGAPLDQSLLGVSLDALIDHAEDALKTRAASNQNALNDELSNIDAQLDRLQKLSDIEQEIEAQRAENNNVQSKLNDILGDMSLDALRTKVSEERSVADTRTLKRRITEDSITLLDREVAETALCPSCGSEHCRQDLKSQLQRTMSHFPRDITLIDQLEARLKQVEELAAEAQTIQRRYTEMESEYKALIDADDQRDLQREIGAESIKGVIEARRQSKSSIEAQIKNQEDWHNEKQARLSKLQSEENFHGIHRELGRLQESRNQIEQARKAYNDLVTFDQSVRAIRNAVDTCLIERLQEEIPSLSDKLTTVYNALTRHPWFDRLIFDGKKLPHLELQVASSQDPGGSGHPTGVLNGQAASALNLVPRFAFSQEDDSPTEVYLVMLDDPTQAFDAEHIGILVERLNELGRRVQLVVGSQETDRFRALLPKHFECESYVTIEPRNWSYHDGPELNIEY